MALAIYIKSSKLNSVLLCTSQAVKQYLYSPGEALRAPRGSVSQISRQSAYERGKIVSPTHRPPLHPVWVLGEFLILNSVRDWVDPRAIVWPEELC